MGAWGNTGPSTPLTKAEWLERHEESCVCRCHTNHRLRRPDGSLSHTAECEEFLFEEEA